MSIEAEYASYKEALLKTNDGEKLVLFLPRLSLLFYDALTQAENVFFKMALSWVAEKDLKELLEKNLLLLLGRALKCAHDFDSLETHQKMEKAFFLLSSLEDEQEKWLEDYSKKTKSLHDKAERRRRRKETPPPIEKEDLLLCEKWVEKLLEQFIPEGSLFLPPAAGAFLPKSFLQSFVLKNVQAIMEKVHDRAWKESLLFHGISFLFHDVFVQPDTASKGSVDVPPSLFESAKALCEWLLHLFSIADARLQFLPKDEATHKAYNMLFSFFRSFSLEQCLLRAVPQLISTKLFSDNLEPLIERVSGDAKAIGFLLKRIITLCVPSLQMSQNPTLLDLFSLGIKGAVVDTVIQDKADELVYNEIPLKMLTYLQHFVYSRAFDRVIYRMIS